MPSNALGTGPSSRCNGPLTPEQTIETEVATKNCVDLMGLPLHNMKRDLIVQQIVSAARIKRKMLVLNANAQMIVLAQKSPWIKRLFGRAEIAFCDGAGVQLASWFLTGNALPRTTPPEWIGPVLRSLCTDASVFWIGGTEAAVASAARRYEEDYGVRTAGTQAGFFDVSSDSPENLALIERINLSRPSIILVTMGMPRQERWIWDNFDRIETGVVISAGALVDHAAGSVHRPPMWIANIGLEWLVRLAREPRRLWRRYLLGLPIFGLCILRVFRQNMRQKRLFSMQLIISKGLTGRWSG